VATLWDVTDRDIDRFAQAVLQQWARAGQRTGPGDSCSSAEVMASASACHTDAPQLAAGQQIAAAVASSRQACRLPALVGAAPVCFGLPGLLA